MAILTGGALPASRSELRTRTALVLEAIALRHQITVLERSRTRRPCFRRFDRLLWILLSRFWPQWRESLMIVQPDTVLRWHRNGWSAIWDIGHVVAGEVGVQGFPVRSAVWSPGWPVRTFSGVLHGSMASF